MGAAFCACLPVPGVFSSARESCRPSLGVSSGVFFVQSGEEISIRLLQHSSPQTWPILQLATTRALPNAPSRGFGTLAAPPQWGTASLKGSVPISLSKEALGLPWKQGQAPGPKFILAIKAPLFSRQKMSFLSLVQSLVQTP